MSNGKGSKRRPKLISQEEFDKNWAQTFGRRKKNETKQDKQPEDSSTQSIGN